MGKPMPIKQESRLLQSITADHKEFAHLDETLRDAALAGADFCRDPQ